MTKAELVKLYVAEGCNAAEIAAVVNKPRRRVTAIMLQQRCVTALLPAPSWISRGNLVATIRPGAVT